VAQSTAAQHQHHAHARHWLAVLLVIGVLRLQSLLLALHP
jgi:hypothetical protein